METSIPIGRKDANGGMTVEKQTATFKERRKFERISAKAEVRYRRCGQSPLQTRLGWSQDICQGGLRLCVNESMAIGQVIRVSLRPTSQQVWWPEINGVVVWQGGSVNLPEGMGKARPTGIYFSTVNQTQINNRIRRLVESQAIKPEEQGKFSEKLELGPAELIDSAYDGSTITYQVLRAFGWGPLNNLGYFWFPSPFSALNLVANVFLFKTTYLLPQAQTRLVRKSACLLAIQDDDRVLDLGCGRGLGSFIIACLNPRSRVTGIDLSLENIRVASSLYRTYNLEFLVDDAMCLQFANETFNSVLCLEAAFHFPDRDKFLKETYRILQRGGRLVLVDFMWKTKYDREILDHELTSLVKDVWKWDNFHTKEEYIKGASDAGFSIEEIHNWSRVVTRPLSFTFKTVAWLGRNRSRRKLLFQLNPLLRSMTEEDWADLDESAKAHAYVCERIDYIAVVLKKI